MEHGKVSVIVTTTSDPKLPSDLMHVFIKRSDVNLFHWYFEQDFIAQQNPLHAVCSHAYQLTLHTVLQVAS